MRFATTYWHNHNNHHKVYWPISPPDLRVVDLLHKLLRDLAKLGFLDVVHHHGQHGQELVLRQLSWFSSHVDRIFDSIQMCSTVHSFVTNMDTSYQYSPRWLTHRHRGHTSGMRTWVCPSWCSSGSSSSSCSPDGRRTGRWQSPEREMIMKKTHMFMLYLFYHLEFQLVVFVVEEESVDDPVAKRVDGELRDSQQILWWWEGKDIQE